MRTLDRYIVRQTLPAFLLALGVLTFLLSVLPMMTIAQSLLTKGVPLRTVVVMLIALVPSSLGLTIPMALLIALLMTLGRMSADREMVALLACGVSLKQLMRPIAILAIVTGGLTLYVMIEGMPAGNQKFRQILFSLVEQTTAEEIKPRLFFTKFTGKVLLVQDIDTEGVWHKVMVADTRQADRPMVTLAERGRMNVRRDDNAIDIELFDLTRYAPGTDPAVYVISSIEHETSTITAGSMFDDPPHDLNSMTIAELNAEIAQKKIDNDRRKPGEPEILPHTVIMTIQQKFSFPLACVVMALLGLGLGVHTRKEAKFAGFALGLTVILVYYALFSLARGLAQAGRFPALLAPWVPNIALGAAAVALLWWQSKRADRSITLRLPVAITRWWAARREVAQRRPSRVILILRWPRFGFPRPRLLDAYVSARYVRSLGLSFAGLLGVFYISTFVDLSGRVFSKSGGYTLLGEYLFYETPQFVSWVVPIAVLVAVLVTLGALTKSSELTIMRACGVSLYRTAAPLLLLSLVWAGGLFVLAERLLPEANQRAHVLEDQIRGRTPMNSLDDRHWLIGADDRLYYYQAIDTRRGRIQDLSMFQFGSDGFHLARHTYAERVTSRGGAAWLAEAGWTQSFPRAGTSRRQPFENQPLTLEPVGAFVAQPVDSTVLSFLDLRREVARRAASGFTVADLAVALHAKLAFPLVPLVMTLIAIPFAVTHGRRGALYGIGVGISLALTYRMAIVFFAAVGSAGLLSPMLAAWAPNLLFVAGASAFLLTVRT